MRCNICHKQINIAQQENAKTIHVVEGEEFPVHNFCIEALLATAPPKGEKRDQWFVDLVKKFSN